MKKILLPFMGLALTLSLASCGGKQNVTIVDENGVEKEVVIENSSDSEVIYNALTYASNPNFDDINDAIFKAKVDFSMQQNKKNKGDLSAEINLNLDKDTNIYSKVFFNFNAVTEGEKSSGNVDAKAYLSNFQEDPSLYLDYSFNMDSQKQSSKIKIDSNTLSGLLEGILGNIGSQIPGLPPVSGFPTIEGLSASEESTMPSLPDLNTIKEALAEFTLKFPNSGIKVDGVSSKSFNISMNLSLNDVLKAVFEENNQELPKLPEKGAFISLSYKVDLKSARPLGIKLTLGGKDLKEYFNLIDNPEVELENPELNLELEFEISYSSKSRVTILTDKEKEDFKSPIIPPIFG